MEKKVTTRDKIKLWTCPNCGYVKYRCRGLVVTFSDKYKK